MIIICSITIVGMWLEHFLLLAPAFYPNTQTLPLSWIDLGVAFGFAGLLAWALAAYLKQFPGLLVPAGEGR
jgi:hypothetical protein